MPKSRQRQKKPSRSYVAPPTKPKPKPSPRWYGFLVLGLILLGVLIIVLNYANFLLNEFRDYDGADPSGSPALFFPAGRSAPAHGRPA